MTDRDKLIALFKKIKYKPFPSTMEFDFATQFTDYALNYIADELLANGVTVPLIPIGSTVYEIRAKGIRHHVSHRKYDYAPDTLYALNNAINQGATLYIAPKRFCKTDKVRLNKTIFPSKEEAEKALKERVLN